MRIVLAEDSTLLREGLVRLLADEGHEVLDAVADAGRLLAAVARHTPDIVVTDVRMPPSHADDGLRAALQIRRTTPGMPVLVLSQYVERRYAAELLAPGAEGVGYVLKDRVAQVEDFLDALQRVADGATALDPEVVRQVLARTTRTDPLSRLTERETAVLALMAEGRTNAAIAARLHVSPSAIEKHAAVIFDKLALGAGAGYSRRVLAILQYLQS